MRRGTLLAISLAALVFAAGCSGNDLPLDADAGSLCISSAQCDDDLFCNGVEQCAPANPAADARGCVTGPSACGEAVCMEASRSCVVDCATPDRDGDGLDAVACGGADCDDTDANRFPANLEVCDFDAHDEDCDPTTLGAMDVDRDGFVDRRCCNDDAGTLRCGEDCNDGRRNVHPLASEVCDLVDNDCNGSVDEGVAVPGYVDHDQDGRGALAQPASICAWRRGYSQLGGDCDDDDPTRSDTTPEACDAIDNDCDSDVDEESRAVAWYPDADGDGYGLFDVGAPLQCAPPGPAFRFISADCDDTRSELNPLGVELCNGLDDNCDGVADFEVAPGDLEDDDGDGHADAACGGDDCNEQDFSTFTGAPELPDARDNDCDGVIDEASSFRFYLDEDGDGYGKTSVSVTLPVAPDGFVGVPGDCDDDIVDVYPRAPELCDAIDNDCDGTAGCPSCGNAVCNTSLGENAGTCPADCTASCGDGLCSHLETTALCAADCLCARDRYVLDHACVACPSGYTRTAGDDATGLDTFCLPDACNVAFNIACDDFLDAYIKPSHVQADLQFGISVAYDGDTLAIAALGDASAATGIGGDPTNQGAADSGAVHVFRRTASGWVNEAYIKASNTGAGDGFALVVLSGDTLVVGASGEDSSATTIDGDGDNDDRVDSGAVYVFTRSGTTWTQQAYLKADNAGADDGFGSALALAGDTLVVGVRREDSASTSIAATGSVDDDALSSGAVYVFTRADTTWSQTAYIKAPNANAGDGFGWSVALASDTLVVGAPDEQSIATGVGGDMDDNSGVVTSPGAAYVFTRAAGAWTFGAYLKSSLGASARRFGTVVGVDEGRAAVGSSGNRDVHLFARDAGTWSPEARLAPSELPSQRNFAVRDLIVRGDFVIAAAYIEQSGATWVNGDETDASISLAGAVYIWRRGPSGWGSHVYLKRPTDAAALLFGLGLAFSPPFLAVGAPGDGSMATGIDGDYTDATGTMVGGVFVYDLTPL